MDDLFGKMQELLSDPESMKQINELAQMLRTEQNSEENNPSEDHQASGFEKDLQSMMPVLMQIGAGSKPDKNTVLLNALRPYLGEKRQERLDRAVKLLRIWSMAEQLQASGILQKLL